MQKSILILGAGGMAGFTISKFLQEKGHNVFGFARREVPTIRTVIGDARNLSLLEKIIHENEYDFIINCIGVLNEAAESDKENAIFLNSYLPHFLSRITFNEQTKIIHVSTDCVFSGKTGNYSEKDFPDGESFYDRTKAMGELIDCKNITLRNSIIGPDINLNGIGLFNWFMKSSGKIKGYKNAIWTGITTIELAKIIDYILRCEDDLFGLTNMVNNDKITKNDLLNLFKKVFDRTNITITPFENPKVDKTLVRSNFIIDYKVPSYYTMIVEMKEWIEQHKDFFPHYKF